MSFCWLEVTRRLTRGFYPPTGLRTSVTSPRLVQWLSTSWGSWGITCSPSEAFTALGILFRHHCNCSIWTSLTFISQKLLNHYPGANNLHLIIQLIQLRGTPKISVNDYFYSHWCAKGLLVEVKGQLRLGLEVWDILTCRDLVSSSQWTISSCKVFWSSGWTFTAVTAYFNSSENDISACP